jgi:hypothetical protein
MHSGQAEILPKLDVHFGLLDLRKYFWGIIAIATDCRSSKSWLLDAGMAWHLLCSLTR